MTFLDQFFWLSFFYFLISCAFSFFIPGDIFISRLKLPTFSRVISSIVFGLVLWALQGFIFGFASIRWMSYIYLLVCFIVWVKTVDKKILLTQKSETMWYKKIDIVLSLIIISGVVFQLLSIVFNGIMVGEAMYFCCGLPDTIYHISLTNELVKQFPPLEPGMAGVYVKNYHYLSNLVIAEMVRVFKLPFMYTQNQYMPFLLSVLMGLSAVAFCFIMNVNKVYTRMLIFFLYFYGDFIYLITFFLGKGLNFGPTLAENATTLWVSPPRVFALAIFFAATALLYLWVQKKQIYTGILMAVLFGSIIGFKVYFGIFVLSGLGFLGLFYVFKREHMMLYPLLLAVGISLLLYLPINSGAGGLVFTGLWRFENFVQTPGFGLSDSEIARAIYIQHNNWLRIIQYELGYAILFFVSLLGIYLLGLVQTRKSLSIFPKELHIFFLSGIFISLCIGIFFIQQVGGANTSQLLFSLYFIGAIYTSLTWSWAISEVPKLVKPFIILVVFLLTVPRVLFSTYHGFNRIVSYEVSRGELQAFSYMNTHSQPSSFVLVGNENAVLSGTYLYINFLTRLPLFLAGGTILQDHGLDISQRKQVARVVFMSKNTVEVGNTLLTHNIDYIYMPFGDYMVTSRSASFLHPILHAKKATILQVNTEEIKKYIREHPSTKKL